jgi:hypothetical protein
MGKTISEWEMYFEQLNHTFLTEVINALETLQKAEMFYEEFEWTHLFTLHAIALEVWIRNEEKTTQRTESKTGEDYERIEEEDE